MFIAVFVAMIAAMITFNIARITIIYPVLAWWQNRQMRRHYPDLVGEGIGPLMVATCTCKNCGGVHPKMPPLCQCSECGEDHRQGGGGYFGPRAIRRHAAPTPPKAA